MRHLHRSVALFALLAALALCVPISTASADPGAGAWDSDCNVNRGKWAAECVYTFINVATDSALLTLGGGRWKVCFEPDDSTTGASDATVRIMEVTGATETDEDAEPVNALTLTGVDPARCILDLGAGRYWVDVVTATGTSGKTATVRFSAMGY